MYTSIPMTHCSNPIPFPCALALSLFCVGAVAQSQKTASPPIQKGVALGLYSEDPNWSYVDMLDEMKAAGVGHVAIVVPYYIKNDSSSAIYKHPRYSVPMHTVERTVSDARERGMKVFLFPILRVEDKSNNGWRGTLKPDDVDGFYRSYTTYIIEFARLAERLAIPIMSVGSELSTLDVDTARWRKIIAAVRRVYNGRLTYSANWDHYREVKFFADLDYAGVTGYFELADKEKAPDEDPPIDQLVHSWRNNYMALMRWQHKIGKPLILTEVGYLSQKGAAAKPWDESASEDLDLEIQRKCYEAFRRVWDNERRLAGAYFWNWFGWGGLKSKEYTPRNKPAAKEVAAWYLQTAAKEDISK
jgi:hypothetical protein